MTTIAKIPLHVACLSTYSIDPKSSAPPQGLTQDAKPWPRPEYPGCSRIRIEHKKFKESVASYFVVADVKGIDFLCSSHPVLCRIGAYKMKDCSVCPVLSYQSSLYSAGQQDPDKSQDMSAAAKARIPLKAPMVTFIEFYSSRILFPYHTLVFKNQS